MTLSLNILHDLTSILYYGNFCISWGKVFLFHISRTLGHLNSLFLLKACTSLQMEDVSPHIFIAQHHI